MVLLPKKSWLLTVFKQNLIDIKKDGSYRLSMEYFKYHRGFRMTTRKFHNLFGEPPRKKEKEITAPCGGGI